MKTCSACGQTKQLTEFRWAKCKTCINAMNSAYYKRNRERVLAYGREWRAKNPDKVRIITDRGHAKRDARLKVDPEMQRENRERANKWYWKNRERAQEKMHARYAKQGKEDNRRNYVRNREKIIQRARHTCAKRKKAPGRHTQQEWLELLMRSGFRCTYCSKTLTIKSASRDHVTPLSRGGTNDISNIAPACLPCNLRKRTRTAEEFRAGKHMTLRG